MVTVDALNSYTDNLAALAIELKTMAPDCVLFPLRGGRKPRVVLSAMVNNALPFEEFSFTNHTNKNYEKAYEAELAGGLTVA